MIKLKRINQPNLVEDIDIESNSVYTEKMSYKEKLKGCFKRVYGCRFSGKPRSTKQLEERIGRSYKEDIYVAKPKFDMNEDVDSIIQIAVNHFWLPPYMEDRAKLIMARMWSYPDNFHDLKYENVVLGILMYVVYEDYSEANTVDFKRYCTYMFGTAQSKRYIIQMYEAYEIVREVYPEVERELQELARKNRKHRRNFYI